MDEQKRAKIKQYYTTEMVKSLSEANRSVGLPSVNPETALKFMGRVKDLSEARAKALYGNAGEPTLIAINKLSDGTNNSFTYGGTVKEQVDTEPLKYGDKHLLCGNREIKSTARGKGAIKASIAKKLGVAVPSIIYLYHSGFWVKLDKFTKTDRIRLSTALTNLVNDTARNTGTYMYAIRGYSSYKIIVDMLRSKISSSSLKLDSDQDIFDYIMIQDLNIIVAHIFRQYYPKGFNFSLNCKNAVNDNDAKIHCTNVTHIEIDFYNTIIPFTDLIPIEARKILAADKAESLTIDDIKEYQNQLKIDKEVTVDLSDFVEDVELKLTLETVSINDYISRSKETYLTISEDVVSEITMADEDMDEETLKENIQLAMDKRLILSIGYYFKSLAVDGEIIDDREDIIEYLLQLEDPTEADLDKTIFGRVRDEFYKFLSENKVAVVAIDDYICPECGESQSTGHRRELIEIDAFNVFYLAKSISG